MPADYLSQNVVDLVHCDNKEMVQAQKDKVLIKKVTAYMLNHTPVKDQNARF